MLSVPATKAANPRHNVREQGNLIRCNIADRGKRCAWPCFDPDAMKFSELIRRHEVVKSRCPRGDFLLRRR